jgi:hypothetical protein
MVDQSQTIVPDIPTVCRRDLLAVALANMIQHHVDDPPPSHSDPATDPSMGAPAYNTHQQMYDYGAFPFVHRDTVNEQVHSRNRPYYRVCRVVFGTIWVCAAVTVYTLVISHMWAGARSPRDGTVRA